MGLINKNGHIVEGVLIQPAYAKLISVTYDERLGVSHSIATFGISTTRENLDNKLILHNETINFIADKQADHIFNDAYTQAKRSIFLGWEDNIVVPEPEEEPEEEENIEQD